MATVIEYHLGDDPVDLDIDSAVLSSGMVFYIQETWENGKKNFWDRKAFRDIKRLPQEIKLVFSSWYDLCIIGRHLYRNYIKISAELRCPIWIMEPCIRDKDGAEIFTNAFKWRGRRRILQEEMTAIMQPPGCAVGFGGGVLSVYGRDPEVFMDACFAISCWLNNWDAGKTAKALKEIGRVNGLQRADVARIFDNLHIYIPIWVKQYGYNPILTEAIKVLKSQGIECNMDFGINALTTPTAEQIMGF